MRRRHGRLRVGARARFARLTLIAIPLALVVTTAAPALADHSWNGYHWQADGPVEIVYLDSLGTHFRRQRIVGATLSEWRLDDLLALDRQKADGRSSVRRECPPAIGAIRICNADYGDGWLGNTELQLEGDRIVGGRIRINDHWGKSGSYRRFVLCHEIGHSLGLWHRAKGSSCLNTGRHPDRHDRAMLRKVLTEVTAAGDPDPDCTAGVLCISSGSATRYAHVPAGRFRHQLLLSPTVQHTLSTT